MAIYIVGVRQVFLMSKNPHNIKNSLKVWAWKYSLESKDVSYVLI